ncbi:GNAT family N-acetyltransferase [Streptomyces sp. NPDC056704]|uniref:GNAT family N-acetyltransferase n=1 Tax=Streptomyces sp. NPDC056704 TaxID=3345917 RepID=UPI0036C93D63
MPDSISNTATDAAVSAFHQAIARLTELIPGAYTRHGAAGTRLVFTTFPVATLNTVCVGRERDLDEVEGFAEELSAAGAPWSIQVRGEVDPMLRQLAARYGRTGITALPLLVWDAESLATALPKGAAVRKVSGAEAEVFANALAAGFGMPTEVARLLALSALLDAPDMNGYILDLHGEAVATGFNVIAGDHVGMFNGSVAPQYRSNGYYRALVMARLQDAVASGARHAFAQNTPMSRPLYESLGFRLAETWTYLTPAD